jgi:predicted Zn-dependent peptidase
MDADAFRAYRASHYNAPSTVVTAAGKIQHDEVVEKVGALLAGLPTGKSPAAKPFPARQKSPRIVTEARDIQQTQLALALPAFGHCDERRFALHLLNVVLGTNASSRLFQEMREKRGLCYSVSSHWLSLNDGGALGISAGLDRRNLEKSLRLILAQFDLLRKKPIGSAELRRAKEYTIGSNRMSLERSSSQNARLGGSILAQGKIVEPETVNERIRAVTPDDILAVACEVLNPSRLTISVVGPNPDEPMIKKLIGTS